MEEHEIVPDLLKCVPPEMLDIKYSNEIVVEQGNILMPSQVRGRPISLVWPALPDALYTLLILDIDGPSRESPELRSVLHWLVVDIPGNRIDKGKTIAEFIGAGPDRDTGLHRYVVLVYEQPDKLDVQMKKINNRTFDGRPKFNLQDFVAEHDLDDPLAGNFFFSEFDDYTLKLRQQLGLAN